jgi:hypothetical protein
MSMNRAIAIVAAITGLWILLGTSPRSMGEASVRYAYVVILLWFAYQRFRTSSGKAAHYSKQTDGPWVRLTVIPAAAPVLWFPAVLSIGLGVSMIGSGMAYLWVLGLVCAGLTWLILLKDHRGGHASALQSFRVNPTGIEVGGVLLRKEDIHHLGIKNKHAGDVEVVYDADRGLPTGVAMGLAARRSLAKVSYRVEAEAGGKAYPLASGLDEVTARGVVSEVGKAMLPEVDSPPQAVTAS